MDERENQERRLDDEPGTPREYFFFRCPYGHENRIMVEEESKYDRLADGQVVVSCQSCSWKSSPFKPSLFQHIAPGDVLLWVYTTRDIEKMGSFMSISFERGVPDAQEKIVSSLREQKEGAPHEKDAMKSTMKIPPKEVTDLADTAEIPLAKTQVIPSETLKEIPHINEQKSYLYFPNGLPRLDLSSPLLAPHLIRTVLWIMAGAVLGFFALRSCDEQGDKLANAIASLEVKSAPSPSKEPDQQRTGTPEGRSGEQVTPGEAVGQSYPDLKKQLEEERESYKKLKEIYEALDVSYQKDLRVKKELEQQVHTISQHRDNLREENQQLKDAYQKVQKEGQGAQASYEAYVQALHSEFTVEQLCGEDKDFLETSASPDGKFFIFYSDQPAGEQKVKKFLQIAVFTGDGQMLYRELFQTKPIRAKEREIPFMYCWDARGNVVVLTRIEGLNSIYHVKFQVKGTEVQVTSSPKLVSVYSPEVLGHPSISPDGAYAAWVHTAKSKQTVEVYALDTGNLKQELTGGGDTLRAPTWSADGKALFFITSDRQGITAWRLSGETTTRNFSEEIYGRFMSCSPDGKYLAFFQKSKAGKGIVNLCRWEWQKGESGEVKILQQDIITAETCKPSWSRQGRFLTVIHRGAQEQVVVQDTITCALFPVFRQPNQITWVDWNCPDALFFTYQEGLYTRPYRVRFASCFGRQ